MGFRVGRGKVTAAASTALTWDVRERRASSDGAAMHPLVIFPGALLLPAAELIERLQRRRRVIVIEYPRAERMSTLLDMIAARLAQQQVGSIDVLGFSYGGWVAQCLAQRYPTMVRDLILAHSFALRAEHAWRFRLGLKLWNWIPSAMLRRSLLARVGQTLKPLRIRSEAEYEHVLARVSRLIADPNTLPSLQQQNLCMLESCAVFGHLSEAQRHPGRRLLIIESDNDPAVRASDRAHLRALYPDAQVRGFPGAGHISALAEPDAFVDAVGGFLKP
jgi:pimeloyl-ACP methyl ester carboxylesterase